MERVEAETQHLGAGGEHSRPAAHRELRARGGPAPAGTQAGARTLARRASTQRFRGAAPTARQAQGRSTLSGVGKDRSHNNHEPTSEAARI